MTELYLNKGNEWKQVFFSAPDGFKFTRENPYFTESESYTLEVSLPMDIYENRILMENIQLIERSKRFPSMKCRLISGNKILLSGSARICQVNEVEVKVQLLGGKSEINFLSEEDGLYVDEMEAALFDGVQVAVVPVYDETNEIVRNAGGRGGGNISYGVRTWGTSWEGNYALQPNLMEMTRRIMSALGYEVTEMDCDREPWNRIFIASAKITQNPCHALPHWTTREFLDEFCKCFNCTMVIDQVGNKVQFIDNATRFRSQAIEIEVDDEFTAELSEESEAHALSADNLEFDLSSSPSHDYDFIPDNVREIGERRVHQTKSQAAADYEALGETDRMRYLYECAVGLFAGWEFDRSDFGAGKEIRFTQVDVFGPRIRDEKGSSTSLKICPAAMTDHERAYSTVEMTVGGRTGLQGGHITYLMPSVENPTGNEYKPTGRGRATEEDIETMQDYITGEAEIEKAEKEDRLQIMFMDDVEQTARFVDGNPEGIEKKVLMPYTDWQFRKNYLGQEHRKWSLSLNTTEADHYLGKLHQAGFTFNMRAKLCLKFEADTVPDPGQVFLVRNKLYGCEKIEATVKDWGLERIMTGYFYEML